MKIEINRKEAQVLLNRLAIAPGCRTALKLYDDITLAMEMEMPEAAYPPHVVRETANLQKSLARPTLAVAQNIVQRVAEEMAGGGPGAWDRDTAYMDLQRVIGMLESVLDGPVPSNSSRQSPSEAPEGSIQRIEAARDREELQ